MQQRTKDLADALTCKIFCRVCMTLAPCSAVTQGSSLRSEIIGHCLNLAVLLRKTGPQQLFQTKLLGNGVEHNRRSNNHRCQTNIASSFLKTSSKVLSVFWKRHGQNLIPGMCICNSHIHILLKNCSLMSFFGIWRSTLFSSSPSKIAFISVSCIAFAMQGTQACNLLPPYALFLVHRQVAENRCSGTYT